MFQSARREAKSGSETVRRSKTQIASCESNTFDPSPASTRSAVIRASRSTTAPVVVVDAVRSPFGRRSGGLANLHANELLATVLEALLGRALIPERLTAERTQGLSVKGEPLRRLQASGQ